MLILGYLLIVMILIVLATSRWQMHPFLTLLLAALLMGFLGGLDAGSVMVKLTEGFGATLKSIGIVIAAGTIIGTFLERSGGANAMATAVLRVVGERNASVAMSVTGFIVSIPVFCDSGFVILSTLNKALSKKTGLSLAILAVALGTGLYTTHVFVPPTPGPLAAAATLGADIGLILIFGLIVSIPTAAAGWVWARFYASRFQIVLAAVMEELPAETPKATWAFTPLLVPILLIALKSIAYYPSAPFGTGVGRAVIAFVGHPVVALLLGVFLAFRLRHNAESQFDWVGIGLKNAGTIILITGAGGAFGNILRTTGIGEAIGDAMSGWNLGIFLPFLIAAVLKTAQGSSTVSIITTAALVSPLLEPLGIATPVAKALVVLAIGAGSMTVSHVNDSYFWVVSQFSEMKTDVALRCHTLATFVQGVVGIATISLLRWLLG